MVEEPAEILAGYPFAHLLELESAEPPAGELFQAAPVDAVEHLIAKYGVQRADDAEAFAVNHDIIEVEFDLRLLLL